MERKLESGGVGEAHVTRAGAILKGDNKTVVLVLPRILKRDEELEKIGENMAKSPSQLWEPSLS